MSNIFVFGSNEAGRHGKGAALWARQHRGAIYGRGYGRQGDSFGIPTKDTRLNVLPLGIIRGYVYWFIMYASHHPDLTFELTAIGTGLAGYKAEDIAPMFSRAPKNVLIPAAWARLLPDHPTWAGETTEQYAIPVDTGSSNS